MILERRWPTAPMASDILYCMPALDFLEGREAFFKVLTIFNCSRVKMIINISV